MNRQDPSNINFINSFVDAVTVRPFFEDLRRIKQTSAMYRELPRAQRTDASKTEAA